MLHTSVVLARAAGWVGTPQGVIVLGAAGGALVVLALAVGIFVALRGKARDPGTSDIASADLSPAAGRIAVVKLDGDEDGSAHARLVQTIADGLGGRAPTLAAPSWKGGRGPDDDDRRARAQAGKSGAGVIVWGKVEGQVLQLHVLAASAPGASEAYAVPADLPPPFDVGVAALVAAIGAESGIPEHAAPLAAAAEALTAAQAVPPSPDDAARLRAIHARVGLARRRANDEPALLAAVLDATAADSRRLLEPLAWAEVRAVRAAALDLKLAGGFEPPLAELHDRARAWRDAVEVWSGHHASERVARAAEALAVAVLQAADRDGDVRALEGAAHHVEAAIARLGGQTQGGGPARLAALHGALRLRLGEREPRPSRLEAAERELRRAMVLAEAAGDPALIAGVRDDLARALARLGERDRGAERLRAAAVIYRLSLTDSSRDELSRARVRAALGRTLVRVGERDKDASAVDEAVGALRMACNSFAAAGASAQVVDARRALERAERLYAELRAPRARTPVGAG